MAENQKKAAPSAERRQHRLFKKKRAGVVLTEDQVQEIKAGRKKLRRDLRAKGIKSKQEFELMAGSLGLYFDKRSGFLLWFFHGRGLWALLGALLLLLGGNAEREGPSLPPAGSKAAMQRRHSPGTAAGSCCEGPSGRTGLSGPAWGRPDRMQRSPGSPPVGRKCRESAARGDFLRSVHRKGSRTGLPPVSAGTAVPGAAPGANGSGRSARSPGWAGGFPAEDPDSCGLGPSGRRGW